MMKKFGFTGIWIDRVMELVKFVTYSFLHNGVEFGNVVPAQGLRQDDPISPYLYITCAEGLSVIIRYNKTAGLIHGCTIARGAPSTISHLLFAYDCYFFFKAIVGEASVMRSNLDHYEKESGQMINYDKFTVIFSPNTTEENKQIVCSRLGVRELQEPGNYLEMPMSIGRRKIASFFFWWIESRKSLKDFER
ncbi:uncharacterized protein LOC141686059 [Apium graveolens]|uniref:uncharacterized protein LOC141686059 n=1 Tax=Apium graveolens TaxID=4045 RepID=UPI003D7AEBBA